MRKSTKKGKQPNSSSNSLVVNPGMPVGRLPHQLEATNLTQLVSVYPRMVKWDLPIANNLTTVASGACATAAAIGQRSGIPNFATRFASLFAEWCVVGARLQISVVPATTNAAGFVACAIEENLSAVPGASILQATHTQIPLIADTAEPKIHNIEWVAKAFDDLTWVTTGSDDIGLYVKLFASVADTLTGGSTSARILIRGTIAVCFRQFLF